MSEKSKPKTPLIGRPFIARHTAVLLDTDLIMLGNSARLVHADLLLFSAMQGLNGLVPKNARALNIALQLDGGVAEVSQAVEDLRSIGKLVDSDDETRWYLADWPDTQADLGNSKTRPGTAQVSAFRRYHRDGDALHPQNATEGCKWCEAGVASPCLEAQLDAVDGEARAPGSAVEEAPVSSGTTEVTDAKSLNAVLWSKMTETVEARAEAGVPVLQTYLDLAETARGLAEKYGHMSRVTETTLANVVVSHAVQTLWSKDGETLAQGVKTAANGFRRDLGTDRALELIVAHSGKRDPVSYITTIVTKEKAA